MKLAFAILCIMTLASAIAAMRLRNLVHSVLCLAITLSGLAGFYLLLNAEFVAFAHVFVYVGAVTILVVFAILLTRGAEPAPGTAIFSSSWFSGVAVAVLAAGSLILCVATTPLAHRALTEKPKTTVKNIGDQLMSTHIIALETIGLLLTAALIGAVVIAMPATKTDSNEAADSRPTH